MFGINQPNPSALALPGSPSGKDNLIQMLVQRLPETVSPPVSTGITAISAFGAGMIDGAMGDQNKIGPVKLTPAIGVAATAGALLFSDNADVAEGLAAIGRGFIAPAAYDYGKMVGARINPAAAPAAVAAKK